MEEPDEEEVSLLAISLVSLQADLAAVFSFLIARASSGVSPSSFNAAEPGQPAKTPPPTLKLATFLILARKAWNDSTFTVDDVECVVASLIDQGYVKAYAIHNGGTIVFRRTPDFGFMKISSVY